jgi:hypothetical protein
MSIATRPLLPMTDPELTDRILRQGRALVRAIEALGTIEPTGPFERALAWFYWMGKVAAKGNERIGRNP